MLAKRFAVGMLLAGAMLFIDARVIFGQDFPSKPIRIVTGSAGGSADFGARVLAQGLAENLGQQVVVDNRSGTLPAEIVSKAPPDGYVVLYDGGSFLIAPLLQQMPYDLIRDFTPIAVTTISPLIVTVHLSLPVKSIKDLIALAKARPGELNYASGASGAFTHLSAELFKAMAGVNIVRIPYKGSGPAVIGLLGGEVHMMIDAGPSLMPSVKAGKVRPLAITSLKPSALLPGVPTVAASGLPGYEAATTNGVFVGAKAPDAVIKRLNQEIVRVLNRADVKERFLNSGVEAVGSSPEELAATVKSEQAKWGRLIKDAGIRVE